MINTNYNSSFPDQVVPEAEKATQEYGLAVARAIENEWFANDRGVYDRFNTNYNNFHRLRLYARGEQSVQKYKDELSINGDLSYLNLDWKPVPVIPKFVDILVNGISQRNYELTAYAQDPTSVKKRTEYAESIIADINAAKYIEAVKKATGKDVSRGPKGKNVPTAKEDIEAHMQFDYKQAVEVSQEEAINYILDKNKYDLIRKRLNYDLTVLGIACAKTCFNESEGVKIEYVDPANLVHSYSEDPYFQDLYYVGEVKYLSIPELKKQFPDLTNEDIKDLQKYRGSSQYTRTYNGKYDDHTVQVLYFDYKTYTNQVFKIKKTDKGFEKALEKQDTFLEAPDTDNFKKAHRAIEVLYSGAKVLGRDKLLSWGMAKNMTRPEADITKVNMNYSLVAPRMYKGRVESIVSRITTFADMIQITHLKLQQVMSRVIPDGVYMDVDGLSEVDLGNGTNYNPAEALNMYFQTGSIVGRSMTQDGTGNPGRVPIQEINTNNGMGKIQSLIQTYQYYLQMIRDVTGLNEARDGSNPDKYALVGLQKLAAANSNVATRHVLQSSLYLTLKTCENISMRIADAIAYPTTYNALIQSISMYNSKTLEQLTSSNLLDFGIFLNLEPDEADKQLLEQNIQVALQGGQIYLEDAIELREVKNLKLANRMLKKKRENKMAKEQTMQQQNMQAQAQANAQASEQAALAESQKQQVITEQKIQLEQAKSQFEIQKLQQEAQVKQQLMEQQFNYDMQLEEVKAKVRTDSDSAKEDRKDKRVSMQGQEQRQTQQEKIAPESAMPTPQPSQGLNLGQLME
tara:strand:+ start:375 stop:2771 length:2397 start_codon:yes stop_codon:yes gene_type:complete